MENSWEAQCGRFCSSKLIAYGSFVVSVELWLSGLFDPIVIFIEFYRIRYKKVFFKVLTLLDFQQ